MNKNIWIYWHEGLNLAPQIVQDCIKSWSYYNPSFKINLLNDENLKEYIDIERKPVSIAAWSDVLRINLLEKYGGLWVDSTVLSNASLENWIEPYIETGFFAFSNPTPENKVCSWFLYTEKDHYIIKNWKQQVDSYWKDKVKPHKYLWLHGLFNELYNENNKFKLDWNAVQKYQANHIPAPKDPLNPHYFVPYSRGRLDFLKDKNLEAPVYKLNRRSNSLFIEHETYKKLIGKMK